MAACTVCGSPTPELSPDSWAYLDACNRELARRGERRLVPAECTVCRQCYLARRLVLYRPDVAAIERELAKRANMPRETPTAARVRKARGGE